MEQREREASSDRRECLGNCEGILVPTSNVTTGSCVKRYMAADEDAFDEVDVIFWEFSALMVSLCKIKELFSGVCSWQCKHVARKIFFRLNILEGYQVVF